MSFIDTFNLLKKQYEKKEKTDVEETTYKLLKTLIDQHGYDNVCDEISFYNEKNESKNKDLSSIINEVKKKVSIEILCSQLFYLDNSDILSQKNSLKNEENKNKKNTSINTNKSGQKGSTFKFKVMKSKNN